MSTRYNEPGKLKDGHFIEALDRCNGAQEYINNRLTKHVVIASNESWLAKANAAQTLISSLFVQISNAWDNGTGMAEENAYNLKISEPVEAFVKELNGRYSAHISAIKC